MEGLADLGVGTYMQSPLIKKSSYSIIHTKHPLVIRDGVYRDVMFGIPVSPLKNSFSTLLLYFCAKSTRILKGVFSVLVHQRLRFGP